MSIVIMAQIMHTDYVKQTQILMRKQHDEEEFCYFHCSDVGTKRCFNGK